MIDETALTQTLTAARQRLLADRGSDGHWTGHLSSSALATATAVTALHLFNRHATSSGRFERDAIDDVVCRGVDWIITHQNRDGGWGDTTSSPSNVSTTTLCWAALSLCGTADHSSRAVQKSLAWLQKETVTNSEPQASARADSRTENSTGELSPKRLASAIMRAYGNDRTFSVPILTTCALAGVFGDGPQAWRSIPALPFELAMVPHSLYRLVGLPVVSYALPALIAIGQARHHHRPTKNPLTRVLRNLTRASTMRVLERIQPASGGFLEAAPLTSFVVMGLAPSGFADHNVVTRGVRFLIETARSDGSWPIDTNLATWLTTLAVNALETNGTAAQDATSFDKPGIVRWLLQQQTKCEHPYTHAAAGAWAWTNLSGGVPDADDTAGALLALSHLDDGPAIPSEPHASACADVPKKRCVPPTENRHADAHVTLARPAAMGTTWLLNLQNRDGGIPTFCKGWGKFPFDRSTPDLTAHTLRAWHAWRTAMPGDLQRRVDRATTAAIAYLLREQRQDGSWVPLWFGNQHAPDKSNPLYGTSRVLRAAHITDLQATQQGKWEAAIRRATEWVVSCQNEDGGWGGAAGAPSTIEETALAVESLASVLRTTHCRVTSFTADDHAGVVHQAIARGAKWLCEQTDHGTRFSAAPIGLYFAKLWYDERLYPLIFTVSALEQVKALQTHAVAMRQELS